MSKATIAWIGLWSTETILYISAMFFIYSYDEFAEWIATLLATVVGALLAGLVGVGLFLYQRTQRRLELLSALGAELEATLDILNPIHSIEVGSPPSGAEENEEEAIKVVVTRLVSTASDEHVRNALLNPDDLFFLVHLNRVIHAYDAQSELLSSIMLEPAPSNEEYDQLVKRSYKAAKQLQHHQNEVVRWCELLIPSLRSKGVPMPLVNRYYSSLASQLNQTDSAN